MLVLVLLDAGKRAWLAPDLQAIWPSDATVEACRRLMFAALGTSLPRFGFHLPSLPTSVGVGSVRAYRRRINPSRRLCRGAVTPSVLGRKSHRRPRFRRQRLDADCLTPLYPFLPDTALAVGCCPGRAESPVHAPERKRIQFSDGLPCGRVTSVLPPLRPVRAVASLAGLAFGGGPNYRPSLATEPSQTSRRRAHPTRE
jgi:hypothetical protein